MNTHELFLQINKTWSIGAFIKKVVRYYWKPVKPPSTDTKTAILIATHKETATAITTIMEKAYFVMEDKVYFVLLTL